MGVIGSEMTSEELFLSLLDEGQKRALTSPVPRGSFNYSDVPVVGSDGSEWLIRLMFNTGDVQLSGWSVSASLIGPAGSPRTRCFHAVMENLTSSLNNRDGYLSAVGFLCSLRADARNVHRIAG